MQGHTKYLKAKKWDVMWSNVKVKPQKEENKFIEEKIRLKT